MHPTIAGGIAMAVVAALGVTIIAWPRWWIRFQQLGMYREVPEPTELYLLVMRFTGIVVTVGGLVLAFMLFTWEARERPDPPSAADQERTAEIAREADLVDRCNDLLPIFGDAVQVDEAGVVTNVDELETLAEANEATIRPMGDPSTTAVIVKVDGVSLFAVPTPEKTDPCGDLMVRLLTD